MSYFDKVSGPIGQYIFNKLENNGVSLGTITADAIGEWYAEYMEANKPTALSLENVDPDFEAVFAALQTEISKYDSWRDVSTSSTGIMLLSAIAAGIIYNQTAIVSAAHEVMTDTARLPNSIYAIARMLGVNLLRKTSVYLYATLNNTGIDEVQIIPRFSQWTVGKKLFFNRDQLVFTEGQSQQNRVILYEGTVVNEEFEANGQVNQRYEIGRPDFSVSHEDLDCYINGVLWTRVEDGLWRYPRQKVFAAKTTANGTVEIIFGNGEYGDIPVAGSTIKFEYIRTSGSQGAVNSIGLKVACLTNSKISGVTETASSGGGDERDPEFYRINAPTIYSNKNKATTRRDYIAIVLTYEDVIDCVVQGQQDINPDDPALFNRAFVSVLTKSGIAWSTEQWQRFETWLKSRSIIGVHLVRSDPVPVILNLTADVYCTPNSDLNSIKNSLIFHIKTKLAPRYGAIGANVYRSDLHEYLRTEPSSRNNVTHVVINNPTQDMLISKSQYVKLGNIIINVKYGERANV